MVSRLVSSLVLFGVTLMTSGCLKESAGGGTSVAYPYVANELRQRTILDGIQTVRAGTRADEVIRLLGNPDEVNPTYDRIDARTATQVGRSFVYLLERKQPTGSVTERAERLVRVHFDMAGMVTRVDKVGF